MIEIEMLSEYEQERGKPMPSLNHSITQSNLIVALKTRYKEQYTVASELSLSLQGKPLTPDICIYPLIKVDLLHDEIKMTVPPLTAIEIVSPTQGMQEFAQKMELYFAAGVKSFWLVQLIMRAVAVYLPDKTQTVFSTGNVIDRTTGIEIPIDEIFP